VELCIACPGERILCVVFGLFFLVVAMAVLITPDNVLDFGFEAAYADFAAAAGGFFEKQGLESSGPISLTTVRILLALVCSVLGGLLTFPGLRLARMHTDAMRHAQERPVKQLMLLVNMILPLAAALAWVRPLARDPLARYDGDGIFSDLHSTVIHLFILLHIHSYIHTFIHSLTHSLIYLHICWYIHTFIHSLTHSFICLFIYLHIYSYICTFIHSFIHSFMHSHIL